MTDLEAVEEGATTAPPREGARPLKSGRSKIWLAGIAIALTTVLALSLGLGLGLPRDKSKSDEATNSVEQPDDGKVTSTPTNDGTDDTSSGTPSTPIGAGNPITFASRLTAISDESIKVSYDSCDSLNNDLSLLAQLIANRTIEGFGWYFDQPTYYEEPAGGVTQDGVEVDPGTADFSAAPEGSSTKAVTESNFGTNNQVEGVEEGDIIQSNGEQVFVVYGTEIIELVADRVNVTSRTKIPSQSDECSMGYIPTMLLIEDRLVVVATSYCNQQPVTSAEKIAASDLIYFRYESCNVHIYDTSDMLLVETVNLNGTFVSARAIGSNVHIVTTTYYDSYVLTQYLEPWTDVYGANLTKAEYRVKAQEQAKEHQQEFVDKIIQEVDCESLQKLTLFQNSDDELTFSSLLDTITTVTSFTIDSDSISTSTTSMMLPGGGYSVYASAQYLILAVQGWWVNDGATQQTYLISYKLDGPSSNATSLGSVPGYILNQFSMDHAVQNDVNYLRVASTTSGQWTEVDGSWVERTNSTSQVTVLKMDDDVSRMLVVGTVENLGKDGEIIYSVRFLGDRGFVTTFETTDPFYTLDLSDPSNPFKVGELEIPGYSSYLHPIGNDLIIGVGQATDADGAALGVQISLFDVSTFSSPVQLQTFSELGNTNSSSSSFSEAEYDFKSFRYLNQSQLLILPITIYDYSPCNYTFEYPNVNETLIVGNSSNGSEGEPVDSEVWIDPLPGPCYEATGGYDGFRVYEVTTSGIQTYLSIKHDIADWTRSCWSGAFLSPRSLVFDGDLMTFKTHTILSYDLSTLARDATPINLDDENTVCEPYILF